MGPATAHATKVTSVTASAFMDAKTSMNASSTMAVASPSPLVATRGVKENARVLKGTKEMAWRQRATKRAKQTDASISTNA